MVDLDDSVRSALAGRYEVREQIGAGGMGHVYRAWDVRHGRNVALKVVKDPRDPTTTKRFREEIGIVARLRHPSILPLHDSGEADGILWFVMPLVDAPSLRRLIDSGAEMRLEQAIGILADIAGAIDHAHTHGIVHRDIKPDNILLESGRAVVADFGIALATERDTVRPDDSPRGYGTPNYMSPEQTASSRDAGPASDIYALGCVAYELLTGERPFPASHRWAVYARKLEGPTAIGSRLNEIPTPARAAILRALATEPADRQATAADFVADLKRAAGRRTRQIAGVFGAASLVLTATLIVTLVLGSAAALDPGRVVIGPIENHVANASLDVFATTVVDYLTRGLQQTRLVDVVPTETAIAAGRHVMAAADSGGAPDPIGGIAVETGAGIVVSGVLEETGGRLQLRLQITDAARGRLLSAPEPIQATRALPDGATELIEAARSRVLGALAVLLDDRLVAFADASRPPPFPAYAAFSRGLERYLAGDHRGAVEPLRQAYEADTTFVTALFYAAVNQSNLGQHAVEDSLIQTAIGAGGALTDGERGWLEYRQAFLRGDRPAALGHIRRLAESTPGSRAVYNLGVESMENRRPREAIAAFRSLPPNRGPVRGSFVHLGAIAVCHHLLAEYDLALDAAREARRMFPDVLQPHAWEIGALVALGRLTEVRERLRILSSRPRDAVGTAPGDVLRDIAEELQAHGHEDLADSTWNLAIRWYEDAQGAGTLPVRSLLALGEAYLAVDRAADAGSVAAGLLRAPLAGLARLDALALRARAAHRAGDRDEALRILEDMVTGDGRYLSGLHLRNAAFIAAALGDTAQALDLLRRGSSLGLPWGPWVHSHPALASIRGLPEYEALTAPVD